VAAVSHELRASESVVAHADEDVTGAERFLELEESRVVSEIGDRRR
jgi:hypothetical protein